MSYFRRLCKNKVKCVLLLILSIVVFKFVYFYFSDVQEGHRKKSNRLLQKSINSKHGRQDKRIEKNKRRIRTGAGAHATAMRTIDSRLNELEGGEDLLSDELEEEPELEEVGFKGISPERAAIIKRDGLKGFAKRF